MQPRSTFGLKNSTPKATYRLASVGENLVREWVGDKAPLTPAQRLIADRLNR